MKPFASKDSLRQTPEREALLGLTWEQLGPGVVGYQHVMLDGVVYFGAIEAEAEGSGDVGRWLDSLPNDTTYRVAYVINPRLEGMLRRRSWTTDMEWFDAVGEYVTVFEKKATA